MKQLKINEIRVIRYANGEHREQDVVKLDRIIPESKLEDFRKVAERYVRIKYGSDFVAFFEYGELK